jgi:hypothetical protein
MPESAPTDAPRYRYDPNLGSPKDTYTRVDIRTSRLGHPELAGRFVAYVDGETIVAGPLGRRVIRWQTEPGTPCLILGQWSDGTLHVKWTATDNYYTLDGRFPAWVVAEDPTAKMAGGGRILAANDLLPLPRNLSLGVLPRVAAVVLLAIVVVWPPAREAVAAAISALLQVGR